MRTRTITIRKGWANDTDYMFSENVRSTAFKEAYKIVAAKLRADGYKELNYLFDKLKGKNATEKIIIKAWYWRGSWASPDKQTYTVWYK